MTDQQQESEQKASLSVTGGSAAAILQRPGLPHTTSYNSQLDFLLRGAALQVQDRALVSSHRHRKRSSARNVNVDSDEGQPQSRSHDESSTDDDHESESESDASDALYGEGGTQAGPHGQRRRRKGDNIDDDEDDDDGYSSTSIDTSTTAEGPELGFDPALAASTATLGPASGPLRTRVVPNLSTAPEHLRSAGMTASPSDSTARDDAEDDQPLETPRLNVPHARLDRAPVRSWSGSIAPDGVAERALEEAATLYALASASSTTSLTRRKPSRRHRTLSTATLRTSAANGAAPPLVSAAGVPPVPVTTPAWESPTTPSRLNPMIPESGPYNTRKYASCPTPLLPILAPASFAVELFIPKLLPARSCTLVR
ncbi:hypothetical protein CF327_g5379 [Tilletia walkeri]|uniref:Uncharacterized protein n=1 Tax=Tilletia walkeri TaxID=117179 RepID=A0A8X7N9G9_9BASI|nr:hypothetical protein CF327_g5379 [Tilletia walkeri]KAE8267951.1 hypothetical protein A4X09_0g4384 [Tilletia walkeri]